MMLSIFLPTIRTHLLPQFIDSIGKSCIKYDVEVVLCGPFQPIQDSEGEEFHYIEYGHKGISVKWIRSYQSPTCSAQRAALACTDDLLLHSVDDALFFPNALDELIDFYLLSQEALGERLVSHARYCDDPNGYKEMVTTGNLDRNKYKHPDSYWLAGNGGYAGHWLIDPHWLNNCHFIMPRSLFLEYGGFDTRFEYLTHACSDLLFRMFLDGVEWVDFPENCSIADWIPNEQGDHGPIHRAQLGHDAPLFFEKWKDVPELKVDLEGYKKQPLVWKERFKGDEIKYEELN